MIISLIAALSENNVIGDKNTIPWHITDDLLHFKELTLHHTVIMGRTSFESMLGYYKKSGRELPERNHIIVTRDTTFTVDRPNCFIEYSLEKALPFAKSIEREEMFIAGGASIFKQTIGLCDRLHLTIVHAQYEGDAFFPDYSDFKTVIGKRDKKTSTGLAYTFLDLERA